MSAAADRPYHHGNLRAALVDAAADLAAESGPSAIVLREAARRVGVSHNAGYRHFAGREDLVAAVAERGMAELAAAMLTALDAVAAEPDDGPAARAQARLRAIGRAYVHFALARPGMFRTAFGAVRDGADEPGEGAAAGPDPYGILGGVVDELVAAGVLPEGDRPHSEVVAWSSVHGLATLLLDGPMRGTPPDALEAALERLCTVVERGLST